MRELSTLEINTVSGGQLIGTVSPMATLSLMVLSPTPLVVAVGTAALLYYAFC